MNLENDIMSAYTVVFDQLDRLGPGDSKATGDLLERLRPVLPSASRVADFGCGVGASALVLAQCLPQARVLALDSHAPFIARLDAAADASGLGNRICAVVGNMVDPPPLDSVTGEFDLIWSESAIYSIGRASAFTHWRPLLNTNGWLVFSDIVWQSEPGARSDRASEFWTREYPDITTTTEVVDELTAAGFATLDPVLSARTAWTNYYEPLRDRLRLLKKHENHSQVLAHLISDFEQEIDVFDCVGQDVALCFFLAQQISDPG